MSDERYDDLFQAENEKPVDYKAIFFVCITQNKTFIRS